MAEPLSEDARAVLAFIRDHPAKIVEEISSNLGIQIERAVEAINKQGQHNLVVNHMRVTEVVSPTMYLGTAEYYPA